MTDVERLWTIIALAVVAIVIGAVLYARHRERVRHARLQDRFGPEYDRAVEELGSTERADRELLERQRRVEQLRRKPLSSEDRAQFAAAWERIQRKFVDDPAIAVTSANELINDVMRARGYPTQHYEQRVADLSVDHPNVVQHYRAAHDLGLSVHNGTMDTEQLRQAVIHYRFIFADLLQEGEPVAHHHQHRAHPSYS
jgi:hypothetical protein